MTANGNTKNHPMVNYILEKGKTHTWYDFAVMFNIKPSEKDNSKRSKAANDIWRAYNRNLKNKEYKVIEESIKNNVDNDLKLQKELLLKEMAAHSPNSTFGLTQLSKVVTKKPNRLLELSLFDLHIGKLAWDEETGENFDSKIACERYTKAIDELLSRVDLSQIERILLPIGNDMINVDNKAHTTTAGTPQTCDGRFTKMIRIAKELLIRTIDKLATVAPVDVVVVPGNHDNVVMFTLGEIMEAWYHNHKSVNVINTPKQRKYYQYGTVGLMFTHGNEEKHNDLGMIFATEEPQLWAATKVREVHLGHFHKSKAIKYISVDEFQGFKLRIIPSLSGTDAWHFQKGYNSMKTAEAYLWDAKEGLIANYFYNVI